MRTRFFALILGVALVASAQTGPTDPAFYAADQTMSSLLTKWKVPGAALAIAKDGRLVYARGFGMADIDKNEAVQPDTPFRIASISKTFTAAGILKLVEQGKLDLEAKAFEILSDLRPPAGRSVDPRIAQITVRQLLTHTAGWDRAVSGEVVIAPPYPRMAADALGVPEPAEPEIIIRYMLGQPLDFNPGERAAYSNLGYCVLGRIIEKVSGERYDSYIRKNVLGPAGIYRMTMAAAFAEDSAPGEAHYYSWPGQTAMFPSVFPDRPGMLEPQYGGGYPEALDSTGAWVGSAIDIVRFTVALDRLLQPEVAALIWQKPDPRLITPDNWWWGLGWNAWQDGSGYDLSKSGALPGTRGFVLRRAYGVTWAVLFNSGEVSDEDPFLSDAANRLDAAINAITRWPTTDRFPDYYAAGKPRLAITGVLNGASFARGAIAPGEALIISGASLRVDADPRVLINDTPAQVTSVGDHQLTVVVPEDLATDSPAVLKVERGGVQSDGVTLPAAPIAPGIFTANKTGRGAGAAVHDDDGSAVTADNPAVKGTMVSFTATGVSVSDPVTITLGNTVADGAAEGISAGVVRIQFRIPADAPSGTDVPLTITSRGQKSRTGVRLAIR